MRSHRDFRTSKLLLWLLAPAALVALGWTATTAGSASTDEKATLATVAEDHRLSGKAAEKALDPGGPVIIQTDPPLLVGLLGAVAAPISSEEFSSVNAWAGWVGAEYVTVYAGSIGGSPTKGAVFIERRGGSARLAPAGPTGAIIIAPHELSGPLRVESASGFLVQIVGAAGSRSFDAAVGIFR